MSHSTALDTLLELSTREADAAAESLGKASAQRADARQRLAMLQQLRDEYAQKLQDHTRTGLSFASYRNFVGFMEKIDLAIAGQKDIEATACARVERAQQAWQNCRKEGKTWERLLERAQSAADGKAARADRKLMDEFAARASFTAKEAG